MDVTLVLTHRCNLACHYCYAGAHLKKDMDDQTMARALDLLFSDGAPHAQLGFFGGEPLVAWDLLVRAVTGAKARATRRARTLLIQCTTNGTLIGEEQALFAAAHGMRVTVSIDGVREAHDLNRPQAGGGSSFDAAVRGLRALVAHGLSPRVLMVVTPATAGHLAASVAWLWDEGIATVSVNPELHQRWNRTARETLEAELQAVGTELCTRRRRGDVVHFEPFAPALGRAGIEELRSATPRRQVVVGTTGHLYPCAPMVGEDRDDGREAALRIGHLDDGAHAIAERVDREGAGCGDGKACACAAYLETGDRRHAGPNGQWFYEQAFARGTDVATALGSPTAPLPQKLVPGVKLPMPRRAAIKGLVLLGACGIGAATGVVAGMGYVDKESRSDLWESRTAGFMAKPEPLSPEPAPPPPTIDGEIAPPPPEPVNFVVGRMAAPDPIVRGKFGSPAPPRRPR
jgi:uncharacterized protein